MLHILLVIIIILLIAAIAGYITSFITADIRIRNIVVILIILFGLVYLLQNTGAISI